MSERERDRTAARPPVPTTVNLCRSAHYFTLAKQLFVSILGRGRAGALPFSMFVLHCLNFTPRWRSFVKYTTAFLDATESYYRPSATYTDVEPPFGGSIEVKNLAL